MELRLDSPHDDRRELVDDNLGCDVDEGMSLEHPGEIGRSTLSSSSKSSSRS